MEEDEHGSDGENIPALPCGKALYSYEGKEPGDLQFSKGDIIILRRKVDDNWYHGELNGCHGFLPASYIQLLRPLSQTPPQGKALYDFEDDVLTVIRRVDENWAEGMLGDKIGIFPILYVELNETAKQLMEIDKPPPTSVPGPSSEPAPLGPCSPGPSPIASPSNGNGSGHRRGEGKKNAKKRHSFSALSVSQRAAQLNNRHSMEISHPVLISSSDPRAAARIQDAYPPGPSPSSAGVLVPPKVASITSELLAHAKVQLPLNIYLALYAYKPQKADELELRKGEMYRVTEKCQDGWFKGTSLRTAASGVFPGNYVTPVSRIIFTHLATSGVFMYFFNITFLTNYKWIKGSIWSECYSRLVSVQSGWRERLQSVHSPPAGSPERPAVALSPLRPQSSSPSRCPGHSGRPLSMVSPGPSLGPSPLSSPASRPLLPLSSPLSCLTPPNVSAVLLNGEPASPLQPPSPGPSHGPTQGALAPKAEKRNGMLPVCDVAHVAVRGRYRVVVPYPPQSEAEIELREGDVVFVHKKREDGWYKGTLQRTGQTGLFPSSFVEIF
ncbi:hypothetical protein F2P81_021006 [Scophthalmus maximus]|uniref:RING-type E3 ubiquitin transferase n=1 Tax=Scophthalmus maximus TaxID=52904 RepID=A0A6A4S158_SCOMX|nr:hypothetical protein F2P81_021006 [Scophthalmus maximus]